MDIEVKSDAQDKRLNNLVAVTVVILSVFMGVAKIKDDNIVQAMQQAKADSVDRWGEYQANKTKLHITQTALDQTHLLASGVNGMDKALLDRQIAELTGNIAKYTARSPQLQAEARSFETRYDALNFHDDQFDMSDALVSIAVSAAAVAALTESYALLSLAWMSGALGMALGVAGFAGWSLHPDFLARWLG